MATCAVFDVSTARCRGITGEEEEDRQQPPRRPMGPIPNTFISSSSSSAPAFSSDDDDEEGSSSSFCSSISTLYSSDDEDNQGGGDEVDSSSSLGLKAKSPLSKMSDLMAQLPIKRGLSRHYNGKSQSFTSLATVASVEDLRKPERGPARKKLKSCRSFGGGMATVVANATHNTTTTFGFFLPPPCPIPATASPAPAINKIGSSSSSPLKMATDRSGGFLRTTSRLPPQPLPPQHRSAGGFPPSHTQALLFA